MVALAAQGIRFVQDLFSRTESELAAILGEGWREMLARARGEDERQVETAEQAAKSYSEQVTFPRDVGDPTEVERVAKGMVDELMAKVRSDGARVRTLTVKVRYPDFTHESHAHTLDSATDIEAPFYPLVGPLLRAAWRKRRPLRLVSVKLSGVDPGPAQLEMFAQADEKRRRLAGVLDKLNNRGRSGVVQHGHQLGGKE